MQHERWMRIERLFAEALELPDSARAAFIAQRCGGDDALRRELDGLLRSHAATGVLDGAGPAGAAVVAVPSLAAGTRVGAWRVEAMIGRGGMGEVYAAARADHAFEQRAALKLLRREAAMHLERFESERRILARLEHAGIARLLDGGVTADGRPYTVMEYVEGRPITDYCRARHSSLPERLVLFAQVCDAVGFAHRHLVIHRDLKPDNILVDARGGVKLLDFGIAKLLDASALPREGDATIAPFTPDYAAPEQLDGQPVTTATDIYALGVLLFELLAGERPLRTHGLPSTQALKLILDRTAPAPSRVAQASVAPPLPARLLAGDLDAIVAKCLRKDARHRYETVDSLVRDLDAHRRSEPVAARSGAQLYVFGRLLRRHRWAAAGTGALILALAAGLAGTVWQARRANQQAARTLAVLGFVEGLFESADPALTQGKSIDARALLDRGAQRVDREFAQQTELRAQLKQTLGRLYLKLGLLDRARDELSVALDLTPASGSGEARVARLLDRARVDLAIGTTDAGLARVDEAVVLAAATPDPARAAIELSGLRAQLLHQRGDDVRALEAAREAYVAAMAAWGSDQRDALSAAEAYAALLGESGRDREALPLLEHVAQIREATLGRSDPRTLQVLGVLADVLRDVDQLPRAITLAQDVLQRSRTVLGNAHPATASRLFRVGSLLYSAGRYSEADEPLAQAIAVLRKLDPTDRNMLASALYEKATSAWFQGRTDEAEQGYRDSGALWTELYGADHRDALEARKALAQILRGKGRNDEAIALIRHVVDVRAAIGGDAPERADALRFLGDALSAGGQHGEAIERLREAEQMALRLYGEAHEMPQQTRVLLGRAYLNAGDAARAEDVTARALAALQMLHPQGHPDVARTQAALARIELGLGHAGRALELARLQYTFVHALFAEPDNLRAAEARGLLGECLVADGQRDAGREDLRAAIAGIERKQPQHAQLAAWRRMAATR